MGVELNAFRTCGASTAPIGVAPTIELNITLDILDGCASRCPGCFVTKKNKFTAQYLKDINHITEQYVALGLEANELFLGPTDLFATTNMEEVVNDPIFPDIIKKYKALTFTSAFTAEPKKLRQQLFQVNKILADAGRHCELFIVLDVPKFLKGDRTYLDVFEENLTAIRDCNLQNKAEGKMEINVFFLLNYYKQVFDEVTFPQLHKMVKDAYQAKIKINPSFGRSSNPKIVKSFMEKLRHDLELQLTEETRGGVFINMVDIHFGGDTYQNYAYTGGNLYVAPFLYDFVPVPDPLFEVKRRDDGQYHLDDMFDKVTELTARQYEYSEKTVECGSCPFLANCVARHYLAYMEHHGITECLMPRKIFDTNYKVGLEEYND